MLARSLLLALAVVASTALSGTAGAADELRCEQVKSIGVAHMTQDGAITLRIRSLPPGPIAETTLVYRPDDPRYDEIKRHLGGIAPGEWKPVPPWC